MNRSPTMADLAQLHRFVREEHGEEAALVAVMRAYQLSARDPGVLARRPIQPILDAVCQHFGVTLGELQGPRRPAQLSRARRVAMYLLCSVGVTQQEAGEILHRSHGDVSQACKQVEGNESLAADAGIVAGMVAEAAGDKGGRLPVIWPKARVA